MSNTPSSEKEAILTFEDKNYDIKSLPKEVQELIKGMQVADAQLRMHEDTLKVIAVGRQHLMTVSYTHLTLPTNREV